MGNTHHSFICILASVIFNAFLDLFHVPDMMVSSIYSPNVSVCV